MRDLLINKPIIGAASGVSSGVFYMLKQALTDDTVLRYAAGIGVWIGVVVAALSFYLKLLEIKKVKKAKS